MKTLKIAKVNKKKSKRWENRPKPKPKPKKEKSPNWRKPPKEHQFKKGEVHNPEGARAHDPVKKLFKQLSKKELIEVGNAIVKGDLSDLERIAEDPYATVLQKMLVSIAWRIVRTGDVGDFDRLLDRLIGKVPNETKLDGKLEGASAPQIIVTLPSNGREAS